jgi:hypothetical protein
MPRLTCALVAVTLLMAAPQAIAGQDTLQKAQALFEAAAYEDALAVLARIPDADDVEPSEYRLLCLLALHRKDEAQRELDTILATHPRYRPDPARVSPGARTQIEALRVAGIRRRFDASLDAGEDRAAIVRMTRVLEQIDGAGPGAGLDDIRLLATTYRGLAQARSMKSSGPEAASQPRPEAASQPKPEAASQPKSGPGAPTVAPTPIAATLPQPSADFTAPSSGAYELAIDERGIVTDVRVKTSVNPKYDDHVSSAVRRIRFQPATRNGAPVPYTWTLVVTAGEAPGLLGAGGRVSR